MSATTIVTIVAALWVGFSAGALGVKASWVVDPLVEYRVPPSWWPWLAAAKAAGAVGLLVGLAVHPIGYLAGACLVLYFAGALGFIARARSWGHLPFPLLYVGPVIAAMVLTAG